MPYAVQTRFDPELERFVRGLWTQLEVKGALTPARHGFEPHISLALVDDAHVDALLEALENLARATRPIPLLLDSVGAFGGPAGVAYVAPVATTPLRELHRGVHHAVQSFGQRPDPLYLPERWVPHATLTERAEARVAAEATELVLKSGQLPAQGQLVSLELVRYRPTQQLRGFRLGE